jgi:hypothetical protein
MSREEAAALERPLDVEALVRAGVEGAAVERFDFPRGAGPFPLRGRRGAPRQEPVSE